MVVKCNNTTTCYCFSNTSNLETNENNRLLSPYVTIVWPASIAVAILSPVAIVGNALVLAAIWRNTSLRTPSYILLAGLAFTDFCTGLICQPFYAGTDLMYLTSTEQRTVVKRPSFLIISGIANFSATYLISTTISMITAMSIERWLHMTRRSLLTLRRVCYTVAGLFLLPIPLLVYRVLSMFGNTVYIPGINIASFLFVLFCLMVTSVAYFKVFQIIRRHQQQIQANTSSQVFGQPAINFVKYKRSVFTVLYILAIIYVSYFPLAIAFGLFLVWQSKYDPVIEPFFDVLMVFVFLSSSLNPLLYLWRMSDIRNEVKNLVKAILCQLN